MSWLSNLWIGFPSTPSPMLFMHFSLFQIVASFNCLTDLSGGSYCDDSAYSYHQNPFLLDCFVAQSNASHQRHFARVASKMSDCMRLLCVLFIVRRINIFYKQINHVV